MPSVTGKKLFHVSLISRSYRNRGKVARAHRKKNAKIIVLITMARGDKEFKNLSPPKKRMALINLINKILIYSAIKRSAKAPLLYSILNPETSSDSPSAKSKGARLVSASEVINHMKARGLKNKANQTGDWELIIF